MASLDLTGDEFKAVEQTRQRLYQLSSSIGSLKSSVLTSQPPPTLESLQTSADILKHNMRSLLEVVSDSNGLFSRLAVHPSSEYPGRTQEDILSQLLRKKAEPDVATSMEEGEDVYRELEACAAAAGSGPLDVDDMLAARWHKARDVNFERLRLYSTEEQGDYFTHEEHEAGIEKVRTGLRRSLLDVEEDGDGAEQGGRDAEATHRPPPPPGVLTDVTATSNVHVAGLSMESILLVATRGELRGR